MARPGPFLASSIGRKAVMAVTGLILFGFVLAHLAGNLQIYMGDGGAAINAYGQFLREVLHGAGLWIARGVLLVAVALHVWSATSLTLQNRAARPVAYAKTTYWESTYASRTMRVSGYLLAFYILFHLAHFTTGQAHPSFVEGDVHHNVVEGFRSVPVSVFYVVANLLLGLHLSHGVWSMLQTLGLSHPRYKKLAKTAAIGFAALVTLGNVSFPLAVLAGVVK